MALGASVRLARATVFVVAVAGWIGCGPLGDDVVREIVEDAHKPRPPLTPEQGAAQRAMVGDRRVPLIPENDVQFIDFFVPHHQMAVEMADIEIERGVRSDVRQMAEMMKKAQLEEIAKMRAARKELTGTADSPMPSQDWHALFDEVAMRSAKGAEVDRMFLEHMIPHHASGLPVAHRALDNLTRGDMKELAKQIIDAQAMEIGEMKAVLGDSCPATGGPVDCQNAAGDPSIVGDRRIAYTPADDVMFIDFLVSHHRDAVMMAEMVIERGENENVKAMAQQMRDAQMEEIEKMRAARRELTGDPGSPPPPPDPHMEEDMAAMELASGGELDRHFVEGMIPHHASALPSAHQGRPRLGRDDLRHLARMIFDSQAREIGELHDVLKGLE